MTINECNHLPSCSSQLLYWSRFSMGPIVRCWACDPPTSKEELKRGPGIGVLILTQEGITADIEKSNTAAVVKDWSEVMEDFKLTSIRETRCPAAGPSHVFTPPEPPLDVPVLTSDDVRYVPRELIGKYARDFRSRVEAEKVAADESGVVQVRTPTEQMPAKGTYHLEFQASDLEDDS